MMRDTRSRGRAGETERTSANGQKVSGNDPNNEKAAARRGESERERGTSNGGRETFLMAGCFWIEQRANEKWR